MQCALRALGACLPRIGCRIRAYAGGALLPGCPFCNLGLRAPKFHSAKRLFKGRRMFHGFLRYAHRNFKRAAFPRTHIPAHPLQNGRFFICAGGSQCIRIFTISRRPQDFWKGGSCARAFCSIGAEAAPIRACGFARIGRFLNDGGRKLEKAAFCAAAKRRGIFL